MINKLIRYYHTLKYLKLRQIYWRLYYRVIKPKLKLTSVLSLSNSIGQWQLSIAAPKARLTSNTLLFLNEQHDIAAESIWNDPTLAKLWLYNLHYFHYLTSNAEDNSDLIKRWIAENPPITGCGWEPYPLSLRIVNWIKWQLAGNKLDAEALTSLCMQVRLLLQRLEYHLLGNHLFVNAKALIFAGLFFAGTEAESWFKKGLKIINAELNEQILKDGGHFELSPMYHALILEDLLDLVNLLQTYNKPVPEKFLATIKMMFTWLKTMLHPDGNISFFNDAALAIAPTYIELEHYAMRLSIDVLPSLSQAPLLFMQESGYARLTNKNAVVIADVAAVGPDYLPGHAHADTLSFELSVHGKRIVVNSGTSCYGVSAERLRQRGTAAHNTVLIDNINSSDVWHGFRVGQRAQVVHANSSYRDGVVYLTAKHNGYRAYGIKHQRTWRLAENRLIIIDELVGHDEHELVCIFNFHPEVNIKVENNSRWVITIDNNLYGHLIFDPQLNVELLPSTYHPEFGLNVPNYKLVASLKTKLPIRLQHEVVWDG